MIPPLFCSLLISYFYEEMMVRTNDHTLLFEHSSLSYLLDFAGYKINRVTPWQQPPPHPPARPPKEKNFTLGSSSTGLVIMNNILKLRYAKIQTCCLNCMQLPLRRPYLHLSLYFLSWHHLDSMINMVFRATLDIWQCYLNVYDGVYYCLGNLICRKYVFNLFFKINNSTITLLETGNKYK